MKSLRQITSIVELELGIIMKYIYANFKDP